MIVLLDSLSPLQEKETILRIVESVVKTLAIIIGGAWVYFRFIRQRENHALIDFTVDIVFHKKIGNWWIVELVAFIENKGKVQHKINAFNFELASIDISDEVNESEDFGGQVLFPHIIRKGSFLPKRSQFFFIEPGLRNKYSYVAKVSENAAALLLHSNFEYLDGIHSHTAERTIEVPPIGLESEE